MFLTRMRASAAEDRSPWGDFWFTPVGRQNGTGLRVTPEKVLTLPVVFACVRVLSESFGVLPLCVYKRGKDGKRARLANHWLLDLLGRRPNAYQTAYEWRTMVQAHLVLRGNAYNRIVTNRQGAITDLMPLHPDRVKIELLSDYDYRFRYTDRTGQQTVLTRAEVWHLRGLSSDGIVGLSMLEIAREAAGLGLSAQDYGARYFQNDAKPGLWIEFPGSFKDQAARDKFRGSFQDAQTAGNRHKTAVLEGGMKLHELGVTNKDSQFLEARQFQVSDIARMFRVPPHMVGDLSKATFSNIEQQSLDFVIHTMTPWATLWESSVLYNLLLDEEQGIEIEFDFRGLLRGDQVARSAYYHNGILDGWMTRNEARASESLEPLDGLDEPLRPLNMVEESKAEEQETNPPKPGQVDGLPPAKPDDSADARLAAIVQGNAARMARRILGGKPPSAEQLAEALGIAAEAAAVWLSSVTEHDEATLIASMMELAK